MADVTRSYFDLKFCVCAEGRMRIVMWYLPEGREHEDDKGGAGGLLNILCESQSCMQMVTKTQNTEIWDGNSSSSSFGGSFTRNMIPWWDCIQFILFFFVVEFKCKCHPVTGFVFSWSIYTCVLLLLFLCRKQINKWPVERRRMMMTTGWLVRGHQEEDEQPDQDNHVDNDDDDDSKTITISF